MLLRIPDFYDSFHCIGGKCPDNCCIGWELDIDDDTYEYYRSVKGPFGDRLRANMSGAEKSSESESVSFRLQVDGRCPFLNAENLCDICLELGPDALCRICTDYPRYSFEWGDAIEKSLTLSCPEAGRLLFLNDIPVRFKEIPLNESGLDAYMTDEKYEEMGTNVAYDPELSEPGGMYIFHREGTTADIALTDEDETSYTTMAEEDAMKKILSRSKRSNRSAPNVYGFYRTGHSQSLTELQSTYRFVKRQTFHLRRTPVSRFCQEWKS